jgi:prepilin-type N-terminal cleavage/methylation domain-containing protein
MTRSKSGFTITELLVVMTIIGVLTTIAIPRLHYTRERASRASMVSDLKNLVALQEGYFSAANDYAGGITNGPEKVAKGASGRISFSPSSGNTITMTRRAPTSANGAGWFATAKNPRVTTKTADVCGIYVGHKSYAPNAAIPGPGMPACY